VVNVIEKQRKQMSEKMAKESSSCYYNQIVGKNPSGSFMKSSSVAS